MTAVEAERPDVATSPPAPGAAGDGPLPRATQGPKGAQRLMPAEMLLMAVDHDVQFKAPVQPRLVPGLAVVNVPGAVMFEGTAERQVLRGSTATGALPTLMPLLDGTRTEAEIAVATGLPLGTVRATTATMYMSGLLEEGADGPWPSPASPSLAFLARHLDTTRVNRSAVGLAARMAAARVTVVATRGAAPAGQQAAALARAVHNQLASCGVAAELRPLDDLDAVLTRPARSATQPVRRPTLVLAVGWGPRSGPPLAGGEMSEVDELCAGAGVPWLHAWAAPGRLLLGPWFDRRISPCYSCACASWSEIWDAGDCSEGEADLLQMAAGLTATQALYSLARVGQGAQTGAARYFDMGRWEQGRAPAYKQVGCPTCCPAAVPAPPGSVAAYRYEQSVEFPPKDLLDPKSHQHHYRLANLALQKERKRYPTSPAIELPAQPEAVVPAAGRGQLDVRSLSVLLARCFGVNHHFGTVPGKVKLWAATGGNLGSPQGYLLAFEVTGVRPGAYYYEPLRGSLSQVAPLATGAAAEWSDALGLDVTGPPPSCLLVVASAFTRVAKKYYDFAYKVCLLDAGVVAGQALVVARSLGLSARLATSWSDDAIGAALGTNHRTEPIVSVLAIREVAP